MFSQAFVCSQGGGLSKGEGVSGGSPIFHRGEGSLPFSQEGGLPFFAGGSPILGNTVNARAVRILLECILVQIIFSSEMHLKNVL